ncbi:HAD family hydrolase [Paenibacillus filicis]|uniref:HAD family hydrolase n=1 Tax=Paenibacillus gyeongsangnamensis TaxID=3388067 RepID=A0ABT4Q543_9BACL|nr:HAD family hydrolase [Paenibacillus filicis]MCZ8511825.1 HAD family hydrolase [Paenibacillus filicis]
MSYKLIAVDMDGTLLNKNKDISEENIRAIREASELGIKVILSTGRPIGEVRSYARKLQLDLPLVVNNGSEIWSNPDKLHQRYELEPEHMIEMFELIGKYGEDLNYWAHTVEGLITRANHPEDIRKVRWLQFAIQSKDVSRLSEIRQRLDAWRRFELSNSHISNVECNPPGISKASGLREVCAMLGIEASDTVAIGDSLNDIPMIRFAGLGVAMGNAQEPVKLAADIVAPSYHEDGVAAVIQKYLLAPSGPAPIDE